METKVYEPHFWRMQSKGEGRGVEGRGVEGRGGLRLDAIQRINMFEIQQKTRRKIQGLYLLSLSYHDMLFLFAK